MVAIESSKTVFWTQMLHSKYGTYVYTTNIQIVPTCTLVEKLLWIQSICFSLDLRFSLQEETQIYYYKTGKKPMGRGFVGPSGKANTIVWSNGCVSVKLYSKLF